MELINENPEIERILKLCFMQDYNKRPSAEKLLEDPFFAEVDFWMNII